MFKKKGKKKQATAEGDAEEASALLVENNIPIWQQLAQDAPLYAEIDDGSLAVTYDAAGLTHIDDNSQGNNGYMEIAPDIEYEAPTSGSSHYLDVKPDEVSGVTLQGLDLNGDGRLSAADFSSMGRTGSVSLGGASPDVNADKMHGLPDGWELAQTPDGRPYYLNHTNKTTSWVRPQTGSTKPNIGDYVPLPAGWEYKSKPRPHFLDHNTQTSHNEDPRPLPEGWSQRVSKHGVAFFVDHGSKHTQWYHPCDQCQADAIEEKKDPNGKTYFLNHDTKESSWDNPMLRPGFFGARGTGLPPGCERKFTDDGKLYYIDHRIKATSWTQPR